MRFSSIIIYKAQEEWFIRTATRRVYIDFKQILIEEEELQNLLESSLFYNSSGIIAVQNLQMFSQIFTETIFETILLLRPLIESDDDPEDNNYFLRENNFLMSKNKEKRLLQIGLGWLQSMEGQSSWYLYQEGIFPKLTIQLYARLLTSALMDGD